MEQSLSVSPVASDCKSTKKHQDENFLLYPSGATPKNSSSDNLDPVMHKKRLAEVKQEEEELFTLVLDNLEKDSVNNLSFCEECQVLEEELQENKEVSKANLKPTSRDSGSFVKEISLGDETAHHQTESPTTLEHPKLYVDYEFPSKYKTLYYAPEDHPSNDTWWLRVRNVNVAKQDRLYSWTLFRDDLQPSDVYQGALGNCWLTGVLVALTQRGHLLRRLFSSQHINEEGLYKIQLCRDGVWTTVAVDDLIPCDNAGYPHYSMLVRKQLWVSLIEKAVAKLHGCYEALDGGTASEAFNLLTGAPCEYMILRPSSSMPMSSIWTRLLRIRDRYGLMTASTVAEGTNVEAELKANGLVSGHLYALLDVKQVEGYRLLKLHDPARLTKWRGGWSKTSHLWTSDVRARLLPNGYDDNSLWIDFDDFINYFVKVDFCKIRDGWYEISFNGTFPSFEEQVPSGVSFVVKETTQLDFVLYQENLRRKPLSERYHMGMFLILFQAKASRFRFMGCSSVRTVFNQHCYNRPLLPGEYIIIPLSFNHWHCDRFSHPRYTLTIHSSKKITAKMTMSSHLSLSQILTVLVQHRGEYEVYPGGLRLFYFDKGFNGTIMLAENFSKSKWIYLKCEESKEKKYHNITSSRGVSFNTIDAIPPLHGQILFVHSHLKSFSDYSLTFPTIKHKISDRPGLLNCGEESRMLHVPPVGIKDFLHRPFSLCGLSSAY